MALSLCRSGDTGAGVSWPASSPNVIAVGGTTFTRYPNGTLGSETAWGSSGGGVSAYELQPSYQANFGLTYHRRAVPDVSYCASGFPVFCQSSWTTVGGTSAGAPQWAAIYALGHSASDINMYRDAKLAYSSFFRDIGTKGYDLVTGLGSPLTCDFDLPLTVYPTSGGAGQQITLNEPGATANTRLNVSYINPINETWVTVAKNVSTLNSNFTLTFKAPHLDQNNLAGDNAPNSDNIVFRAVDNYGNSFQTVTPYTEWRRSVTQVANLTAAEVYGNDTNLSTAILLQNNQTFALLGKWFSPGNASVLWGTEKVGVAVVNGAGVL